MGTPNQRFDKSWDLVQAESLREAATAKEDSKRTQEERNTLGQFSTPVRLAKSILNVSLGLLPKKSSISFLEPSVGSGSFVSAALEDGSLFSRIDGLDIDKEYLQIANECFGSGCSFEVGDFLEMDSRRKYDLILTNPPYVRHHHISQKTKSLKTAEYRKMGINFSGLSGLYCYFILESLKHLSKNGISGWLIPSEFLDVNYGDPIKKYLLTNLTIRRIHVFPVSTSEFSDALVSSCVFFFENLRQDANYDVVVSYGPQIERPDLQRTFTRDELKCESKWSTLLTLDPAKPLSSSQTVLGDFFEVKRGIATGGNDFFVLPSSKLKMFGIPKSQTRPILPSARYVDVSVVEGGENGDPINVPDLFLISTYLEPEQIKENFESLWSYLEKGIGTVSEGYICKNRVHWYWQERRDPPLFFCTYMGRSKKESHIFRVIMNKSNAIANNSFLMLYPTKKLQKMIDQGKTNQKSLFIKLCDIDDNCFEKAGRTYGGGLHKIEPKELMSIPFEP
jgi:adenine-specific DNA-methyltransferase